MAAPNPKLEAAFKRFGTERGITAEQVNQLRDTVVATPALLQALNQDADKGHLRGFTLVPLGRESIGFYDRAKNTVAIPTEMLTGQGPADRDLGAVLKLQDMSLRFAHAPKVTADMHSNLQQTLNGSPFLANQFKDAVRDEGKRHLRGFDFHTDKNSGGGYDPESRTMHLTERSLKPSTFDQANLSFVLGHEMQHGFYRLKLQQTRETYMVSLLAIAGDNNPVNDYTAPAKQRLQVHRTNEAEANIAGWNAMLGYERRRSGKAEVSLQDVWDNTTRERAADFLTLDSKGHAIPRPGLTFNADSSLTPTPGPNGNVEASAKRYFDRPALGTPGVDPREAASFGPYGHSDYRNFYGPEVIGDAIWAEREMAIPKHGKASQMRLNMRELGLSEKLIEENGLFIEKGTKASQVYQDTSTSPPTVGRFDHTDDGANRNRYVPIRAPELADPTHGSDAARAGHGVGEPARHDPDRHDPAPQPKPSQAPLLSDSAHPGHAMYLQTLKAFDASPNIPAGTFAPQEKERLAAGVVTQALTQKDQFPQARIDHVVFSTDRSAVIGVMGPLDSPTQYLAAANVQNALATPLEQSAQVSQTAMESLQQKQEQIRTQAESMSMEAPTRGGGMHH